MSEKGSQSKKVLASEQSEARDTSENKKIRLRKLLSLLSSDVEELVKDIRNDLDDEQKQNTMTKLLENDRDELKRENDCHFKQIQQRKLQASKTGQYVDKLKEQLENEKRIREEAEKKIQEERSSNASLIQFYKHELSCCLEEKVKQKQKIETAENETRKANEDLLRLSRMDRPMIDALTDDIPNATELSDQNRPTKLAEHYQEIYDNEWTDAFEILYDVNKSEELTIGFLIRILKEMWKFCDDEAGRQTKTIQEAIFSFSKDGDMNIPSDVRQQIRDCRRNVAVFSGKQLFQKYQDKLTRLKSSIAVMSKRVPNFVKECFNICWLMTVQDPQMAFGWNITKGDRFDKDMYRVYTKYGSKIDFVVWPVLLLHTNGSVLTKGVAQGLVDKQPENSDKVQNSSDQVWGRKQ